MPAAPGYTGRFRTVVLQTGGVSLRTTATALIFATGCGLEDAYIGSWEVGHLGRCDAFFGSQVECCAVASILSIFGLKTEVRPEWEQ
ncbi:MAG: hypothetical protein KatS3mg015_1427 [Fimbriimonadales bacterium]|nr:MAG: hypothetical protein KatS3mg015_1427 [Fimbriimonadales bacterium]